MQYCSSSKLFNYSNYFKVDHITQITSPFIKMTYIYFIQKLTMLDLRLSVNLLC